MKLAEEIDLLLENYEQRFRSQDISRNTLRAAKNSLGKLKVYWGHLPPEKLTKEMWEKFQIKYDDKFKETQFNLCKFATVLAKFLYNKGAISKKPELKNMFQRRERDARRKKKNWLYTKEQVDALISSCENDKETLAIQLGARLAFRISDVVQLTWERVVIDGKVAYV